MWTSNDVMVAIPLVLAALSIGTSYLLAWFWRQWHRWSLARRLGCRPAPRCRSRLPFGLSIVAKTLAADRDMRLPESFRDLLRSLGEDVRTCSMPSGMSAAFFTCDAENIQAILAKNFEDFELGRPRKDAMYPLLGSGIFTQDGHAWRNSRAILRPAFYRDQVNDLHLEGRHLDNLLGCLRTSVAEDNWTEEVDLQELFFRYTLDSSAEYLFGGAVESQLHHLQQRGPSCQEKSGNQLDFAAAFDKSMEAINVRIRYVDIGKFIWPSGFHQACQDCHRFVDEYVQAQLERQRQRAEKLEDVPEDQRQFFDILAADVRDPVELRSQLLTMLLAGRDTTAGLLGWIFYSLARDPVRYQRLRHDVLENLGSGSGTGTDQITLEGLRSCQYLQWVIDETLRLYPAVPLNRRTAVRDTVFPRGGGPDGNSRVFVPKGSTVIYSVYDMQRRKDIWGGDADEFIPERWDGRRVGWEYLPFNGGPRICLGQQLALTKVAYVTARLAQKFDRIDNLDPEPVKHRVLPTMSSGTGVKVRLHWAPSEG